MNVVRGLTTALALLVGTAAGAQNIAVKVGVLTDLSGPYADLTGQGSIAATEMAAEDFMAANPGVTVAVVSADHQNKADIGSEIVRRWFDRDGDDAVVDVTNSAVALAVRQIAREDDKVFLASGPATTALTGKACSPNTVQWTYDTFALSHGTGGALAAAGGDKWFFITADYAFSQAMEHDTSASVAAAGDKVLGHVRAPLNTTDFSPFLLQSQASGANVVGLANAGADAINSVKQAAEFGLNRSGIRLAGLLMMITDIHSLGTQVAQGLVTTEAFYWDLNDDTRAWSMRFAKRMNGKMPSSAQVGAYFAVLHYLKAVAALKAKDGAAVVTQMKAMPTDDPVLGKGSVRADGRKIHDMYLFQVKTPAQSTGEWDLYTKLAIIPADQAFRPPAGGACALVQ